MGGFIALQVLAFKDFLLTQATFFYIGNAACFFCLISDVAAHVTYPEMLLC